METPPLRSKFLSPLVWGIGIFILALLFFRAGELVGFKRAEFSYQRSEHYYRDFTGPRRGMSLDFGERDFMMSHGIFGSILKVTSGTLLVQDQKDNAEKVVLVESSTVLRRFHDAITIHDLREHDPIIIIGSPNTAGQIEAQLIRALPSSSLQSAIPLPQS